MMITKVKAHVTNVGALYGEKMDLLRDLLEAWKDQFEEKPVIPFCFTVNEHGLLFLGDIAICGIEDISATGLALDSEHLYLDRAGNPDQFYRINLIWNFNEDPVFVDEVSFVLYQANG